MSQTRGADQTYIYGKWTFYPTMEQTIEKILKRAFREYGECFKALGEFK